MHASRSSWEKREREMSKNLQWKFRWCFRNFSINNSASVRRSFSNLSNTNFFLFWLLVICQTIFSRFRNRNFCDASASVISDRAARNFSCNSQSIWKMFAAPLFYLSPYVSRAKAAIFLSSFACPVYLPRTFHTMHFTFIKSCYYFRRWSEWKTLDWFFHTRGDAAWGLAEVKLVKLWLRFLWEFKAFRQCEVFYFSKLLPVKSMTRKPRAFSGISIDF